ncbi:MAG TPA: sulfotransferase [Rubrobacter sp.]
MNPYVFIVGCPRSGTTLLRRLVDTHPHIAIIHQSRFIPNFFERRRGLTPQGLVTTKLVDRLLEARGVKNLETSREMLESLVEAGEPVSYSTFVTGVFDLYGKGQAKRLVGDKTPAYVRRIPTLNALWPEARFVHLIRDGRDVCLSAINWRKADHALGRFSTWGVDPITTAAVWWEWHVRLGREDGGSLAPNLYHEVRYEALVSVPEETCAALCDFLGLPYDDAMLKFHQGRENADPNLDAKKAWRPLTPGLRKWSEQMPAEDLERFEAAAGDLLEELGYPRACPPPPEEKLARAVRIRESFTREASASGKRLPKGWER